MTRPWHKRNSNSRLPSCETKALPPIFHDLWLEYEDTHICDEYIIDSFKRYTCIFVVYKSLSLNNVVRQSGFIKIPCPISLSFHSIYGHTHGSTNCPCIERSKEYLCPGCTGCWPGCTERITFHVNIKKYILFLCSDNFLPTSPTAVMVQKHAME
jgi:hypothetical protein